MSEGTLQTEACRRDTRDGNRHCQAPGSTCFGTVPGEQVKDKGGGPRGGGSLWSLTVLEESRLPQFQSSDLVGNTLPLSKSWLTHL